MKNQSIITFLGPPGSGKGTQAILLSEKFDLYHFETSKIIEQSVREAKKGEFISVKEKKYYFENEWKIWKKGILCSPPFVSFLIREKIKKLAKEGKGIVFSGSPRTLYEVKEIAPLVKKLYGHKNIKVFQILLSPEATIFRNSHRRICELMRHPILWNKETENLKHCPLDGSKLVRRKGLDNPEVIKTRLKEFAERTLPLIDFYKDHKFTIKKFKGEQSVEGLFKDILKVMK